MKLDVKRFDLRLAHTWTLARTSGSDIASIVIVELRDSDGILGLGEASPITRYQEDVNTVEAFVRSIDPDRLRFDELEPSLEYLRNCTPGNSAAKCAVEVALVDGAAKLAGQSVHDFLQLGFREDQHVTSFTIGIDTPEVIRSKVLAAASYPVLKMKVGVAGDRENLAALRDVAPAKPVRVDANEGWPTKEAALSAIEWLASDGRIQFVEQPMPASVPIADWVWLKARSPLPVFGDESYHQAKDVPGAAECFHGINVKLVKAGGITAGLQALRAARQAGLKTMLGCMIESSILITAAAHLAEMCDYLDLDGNVLVTNDPYQGVTSERGVLSFRSTNGLTGLGVTQRAA